MRCDRNLRRVSCVSARMRTIILFMTVAALTPVSAANAQEKKPGVPEAQQLMERARQAKEAGRYDEARELAEKARQAGGMHHEGKPGTEKKGPPERLEKVRREIEELHRTGRHEEAARLKQRVAEAIEHKEMTSPDEGGRPERLRHVMEAIRHLREAGLHEPAEGLEKMANKMREEMERRAQAGHAPRAEKACPAAGELHAMREQLEKLGRAVEDLRAKIQGREEEVRKPRKE